MELVATHVMGGVQKMFLLAEDEECDCSVAAVTSGVASLGGLTIAEVVKRYRRENRGQSISFSSVDELVQHFVEHLSMLHSAEFANRHQAQLNFMIAGYCSADEYIKVFHVNVNEKRVVEQFPHQAYHFGLAWDGQTTYAARLITGVDANLRNQVNRQIAESLTHQRESILESLQKQLDDAGVALPEGLELTLEEEVPTSPPWSAAGAPIDWANLPTQTAVELVSALVNAESGMQKFVMGIPTVGGRTRIGLLRRNVRFTMLNEPSLTHLHTGYVTDA